MELTKYFIETDEKNFSGWLPEFAGLKLEAMLWGEIFTTTILKNGFWSIVLENYEDTDYYFISVRVIDTANKKMWHYGWMGFISIDLDFTNTLIFSGHHYPETKTIGRASIRLVLMDEYTIKNDHFTEKGWSIELPTHLLKTIKNENHKDREFWGTIFLDRSHDKAENSSHEVMGFWFFNAPPC